MFLELCRRQTSTSVIEVRPNAEETDASIIKRSSTYNSTHDDYSETDPLIAIHGVKRVAEGSGWWPEWHWPILRIVIALFWKNITRIRFGPSPLSYRRLKFIDTLHI